MRCLAFMLLWISLVAPRPAFANGAAAVVDDRIRTVILGITLRRGDADPGVAHALSDVALAVYASDARRVVIGPDDIRRALDWEADRQTAGCDSESCLAEVSNALDAARIVSGTVDAVGDEWLVTLSEIDARTLEPIARAQDQCAHDEASLFGTVRRLAGTLRADAARAASNTRASVVVGNAGSIAFRTDPGNAHIFAGAEELGMTPTTLHNIAAGRHTFRIVRADYEPVEIDVPVAPGGETRVDAALRLNRTIAEQNFAARSARHSEERGAWQTGLYVKGGAGIAVIGVGTIISLGAFDGSKAGQSLLAGSVVNVVGAALVLWAAWDLMNPPAPPLPEWKLERKVVVTPPTEAGAPEVQVLQSGIVVDAAR